MIAGIDEAGRGPVLGPLVMCALACDNEDELKGMGVKDSKLLSPEKRIELFEKLQKYPHEIVCLQPDEIDAAVDNSSDNLNKLEARTAARLIAKLAERVPLDKVILDSPTRTVKKFEAEVQLTLRKLCDKPITLQCEIKADLNHPVVGAASVLAKVTRDAAIRELETTHGPLGSGYPSDPATQEFLASQWQEQHGFFRKSWESYKRLEEGRAQTSLSNFDHKAEVDKFEVLRDHGFAFLPPTNQYEVVRMKKDKTTIIRYTTGKILIQGAEKESTEKLLKDLKLG